MNNIIKILKFIKIDKSTKKLSSYIFTLLLLFCSLKISASLLATIANTIVGNAPIIPDETIEKIKSGIYFSITDPLDFSYDYSPGSLTTIDLPLGSKFSEITPKVAPNLIPTDITDSDGDILSSTLPYSISNFNYTWQYSNGTAISSSSTDNLGANICIDRSSYKGPYKLNISFDITVNTEYGDPHSTTQAIGKTFTVNGNDGICMLRPGTLTVATNKGWPDGDDAWSGGRDSILRDPAYDSDVWVLRSGFKAWVDKARFPTTAFPEARFRVDTYKGRTQYTFSLEKNPNGALIDQQAYDTGQFKFGSIQPALGELYVIKALNKTTNVPFYYSFKLKSSRSWFYVGQVTGNGSKSTAEASKTYADAVAACGSDSALPTRAEITNSAFAASSSYPPGNYYKNNGFQRAIGTLEGEWGAIYYYAPKTFNDKRDMMKTVTEDLKQYFSYWYYWTQDQVGMTSNRFMVGDVDGNVRSGASNDGRILCVK